MIVIELSHEWARAFFEGYKRLRATVLILDFLFSDDYEPPVSYWVFCVVLYKDISTVFPDVTSEQYWPLAQ